MATATIFIEENQLESNAQPEQDQAGQTTTGVIIAPSRRGISFIFKNVRLFALQDSGPSLMPEGTIGILKEVTGQKRDRLYSYTQYLSIMNQGTELPP